MTTHLTVDFNKTEKEWVKKGNYFATHVAAVEMSSDTFAPCVQFTVSVLSQALVLLLLALVDVLWHQSHSFSLDLAFLNM